MVHRGDVTESWRRSTGVVPRGRSWVRLLVVVLGEERGGDEQSILVVTGWREAVESVSVGVEGRRRVEFFGAALRVRRGGGSGGGEFGRWLGGSWALL
jgi:hypothetical protein